MMIRILCCAAALGAAVHAYRVTGETAKLDTELRAIGRKVEEANARTQALRAEWAWLNEPERLRGFAQRYLPVLEPMQPTQFLRLAEAERRLPLAETYDGPTALFAARGPVGSADGGSVILALAGRAPAPVAPATPAPVAPALVASAAVTAAPVASAAAASAAAAPAGAVVAAPAALSALPSGAAAPGHEPATPLTTAAAQRPLAPVASTASAHPGPSLAVPGAAPPTQLATVAPRAPAAPPARPAPRLAPDVAALPPIAAPAAARPAPAPAVTQAVTPAVTPAVTHVAVQAPPRPPAASFIPALRPLPRAAEPSSSLFGSALGGGGPALAPPVPFGSASAASLTGAR